MCFYQPETSAWRAASTYKNVRENLAFAAKGTKYHPRTPPSHPLSGPWLQGGRSVRPSSTIILFRYSKHTAFNERLRGGRYTNGFARQNQKNLKYSTQTSLLFFFPPLLNSSPGRSSGYLLQVSRACQKTTDNLRT